MSCSPNCGGWACRSTSGPHYQFRARPALGLQAQSLCGIPTDKVARCHMMDKIIDIVAVCGIISPALGRVAPLTIRSAGDAVYFGHCAYRISGRLGRGQQMLEQASMNNLRRRRPRSGAAVQPEDALPEFLSAHIDASRRRQNTLEGEPPGLDGMNGIIDDDGILKRSALGIRTRIRQALAKAAITQAEVTRRAQEISPKAIKQLLNNALVRGAMPRDPVVQRAFAEALGVDPTWLWNGPRSRGRTFVPPSDQEVQEDLGRDAAELEADAQLRQKPVDGASISNLGALPMRPDPAMYAVPVTSADWEPTARMGDCVLVTPSYPPVPGALVYMRDKVTSGLYRLVAAGQAEIFAITPAGMPIRFSAQETTIHRVGGIICG